MRESEERGRDLIRSTKLRKHARGQPCTLRFDCCDGGGETTVLAHIRDAHKGMGIKASDLSACYACGPCHDRLDREPHKIEPAMFYWHQLRGLQETLEILVRDGLVVVPQDAPSPSAPKARKPRNQRKSIQSRGFDKTLRKKMDGSVESR